MMGASASAFGFSRMDEPRNGDLPLASIAAKPTATGRLAESEDALPSSAIPAELLGAGDRAGLRADDARLARLEESVADIATATDSVLQTVHGFEALMSVGLLARLDALADEKLTVVARSRRDVERAHAHTRRLFAAAVLSLVGLGLEVRSDAVSQGIVRAWQAVSVRLADAGDWIEAVAANAMVS